MKWRDKPTAVDVKTRVLLVCMGNICRSPLAEGVLRQRLAEAGGGLGVVVDSAGTHGYHAGSPPDRRAQVAAARRGIDIRDLRAREVAAEDFETFDLILAMDEDNLIRLEAEAPEQHRHKLRLFLEFAQASETEVPDPYYGGAAGFERVLDLVEDASHGLLEVLRGEEVAQNC